MSNQRKKAVLVLDIGTSFVKIGLFDLNANPIEGCNIKFEHWMTIKTDGTYTFNALESAQKKSIIGSCLLKKLRI